jgi:hypothetical protein
VEWLSGGVATVLEEAGVTSRVIDGGTHRLALRLEALAEASDWIERQLERTFAGSATTSCSFLTTDEFPGRRGSHFRDPR